MDVEVAKPIKLTKELELHEETNKLVKSVREWDIPKLDQETKRMVLTAESSENNGRKKKRMEEGELESAEPPKTLDDLFRKTQVTPHIYWLPLTDEQYLQKEADFQKRQAEREVRMEERKKKEAENEKVREERRQARRDEVAAATTEKEAGADSKKKEILSDSKAESSFESKRDEEVRGK
jgi:hypothetical protein